jgi:hypothetical protein
MSRALAFALRAAPAPEFRAGHTLPPLTRWGWSMPYEVRVELCERWGYALEFGGYATPQTVARLDDPTSVESKLVALTRADPKRYPLCVLTIHGDFGELPDAVWTHDAVGGLPEGKKVWSPEAPLDVFRSAAEHWAEPLRRIRERAPIAVVLNGGEYALSTYGHHGKYWERDPKVTAARGQREWFAYASERKAQQERVVSEAFRKAVPDRQLYLYYFTDGGSHRNRYGSWWQWAYDYTAMRGVSDIPNSSVYYRHFNSGWTGDSDMLTQALNSVTNELAHGDPLSYNWVSAGWLRQDLGDAAVSDPEHYMGYLKCYYTAGMTGGVAGYFSVPRDDDPGWLWQMMTLAHAHALFSHLETFLRDGDLLPGPDRHRWSHDRPACELPTGDADSRVVARKHRRRAEWLLTAWAAGGPDREVTVDVPELGKAKLSARSCGSVYRATRGGAGEVRLRQLDADGMQPTVGLSGRAGDPLR